MRPAVDQEWWDSLVMPEPNTGCHLWMGRADALGYGHVSRRQGDGELLAHRAAYRSTFGAFDRSLKVCHRCDTPSCVNPDHLFLGTQKDNLHDMYAKGRGRPFGVQLDRDMSNWRQW